jgi:hypothetical protein
VASELPAALVTEQVTESAVAERSAHEQPRVAARRWSPAAVVVWAIFAGGLLAFIVFARVPIAAGWRQGRSMRVLDIWSLFVHEVSVVAAPFVTPGLITALVVVVLAGSLVGLWLAMSVTSNSPADRPD